MGAGSNFAGEAHSSFFLPFTGHIFQFTLNRVTQSSALSIFAILHETRVVVSPNFGQSALISSLTKYKFLQVKNRFSKIVPELSV